MATKQELLDELGFPATAADHFTEEQLAIILRQDPDTWKDSLPPNAEGGELHVYQDEESGFWTVVSVGTPDGTYGIETGLEDPAEADEWLRKLWNHHTILVEEPPSRAVPDNAKRRIPEIRTVDHSRRVTERSA